MTEKHSVVEMTDGENTRYAVVNDDGLFLRSMVNQITYTAQPDEALRWQHAEVAFVAAEAAEALDGTTTWTVVRTVDRAEWAAKETV